MRQLVAQNTRQLAVILYILEQPTVYHHVVIWKGKSIDFPVLHNVQLDAFQINIIGSTEATDNGIHTFMGCIFGHLLKTLLAPNQITELLLHLRRCLVYPQQPDPIHTGEEVNATGQKQQKDQALKQNLSHTMVCK